MSDNILELIGISYAYTNEQKALRDISLGIKAGERIAILGNNGAGKSTLFLNCNGVLTPRKGRRLLRGREIGRKKSELMELRREVGIVFQDPDRQFVAPTAEGELSFGPLNLGLTMEQAAKRIGEVMALLDIEHLRGRAPHTLSGGEKKLLGIGGVLAMGPSVILMDEPAAGLDPQNCLMFEKVLAEIQKPDMALAVSTHDVDFAWRWAGRIIVMHKGSVLADGSPLDVFSHIEVIKKAGLIRPSLMEVTDILKQKGYLAEDARPAKTHDELGRMLGQRNGYGG